MTDVNIDGMALAPGVVETIISIAAHDVAGVASLGPSNATSGFRSVFGIKNQAHGIEIDITEEDKMHITLRLEVLYGFSLPDIAAGVRSSVADAVTCQIGIPVDSIDVYIDGIQFHK